MSNVMWDAPALAECYDRISDIQFTSGRMLVDRMKIARGDNVLDVGCGTGRLALYVSKVVKPSGNVIGIDPSPHRIRVAEGKMNGAFQNVRFSIGQGEDLFAFPGNCFDGLYYSSVFHWIDDKPAALGEAFRVLKPGGKVGMTTVDRDYPFAMKRIMQKLFSEKTYAGYRIEDEMGKLLVNRAELYALLEHAGFKNINIGSETVKYYYPTVDEFIRFIEASSFGNFMRNIPDRQRPYVIDALKVELEKLKTPAGIELESNTMYAISEKP